MEIMSALTHGATSGCWRGGAAGRGGRHLVVVHDGPHDTRLLHAGEGLGEVLRVDQVAGVLVDEALAVGADAHGLRRSWHRKAEPSVGCVMYERWGDRASSAGTAWWPT